VPVPPTYHGEVDDGLQRVLGDLEDYTAAAVQLRDELDRLIAWNAEDAEYLRSGMAITDSMRRADSARRSRDLTRYLDEFESVRRAVRVSVTALMLDDGNTVTEVGDAFGVSRQLAHRFATDRSATGGPAGPTEEVGP